MITALSRRRQRQLLFGFCSRQRICSPIIWPISVEWISTVEQEGMDALSSEVLSKPVTAP